MSRKTHINQLKKNFAESYDKHANAIFRFAYFKLGDMERAHDIVQDVFVKFWEYVSAESDLKNEKALLYKIASNAIIDVYRKRKEFSLDALSDDGFDPTFEPDKDVFERHDIEDLLNALNRLNEDDRNIMFMRYIEGLSFDDISDVVGDRPNTIAVKVHRLIKQLRDVLNINKEHGI